MGDKKKPFIVYNYVYCLVARWIVCAKVDNCVILPYVNLRFFGESKLIVPAALINEEE